MSGQLRAAPDQNTQYGAVDPQNPNDMLGALQVVTAKFVREWRGYKGSILTLMAATFPAITTFWCSGLTSVPAAGQTGPGVLAARGHGMPNRILGFECWNFDPANALQIQLEGEASGQRGANIYLGPNTYYVLNISLPPQAIVQLINLGTAAVQAQLKVNGI